MPALPMTSVTALPTKQPGRQPEVKLVVGASPSASPSQSYQDRLKNW